MVAEHERLPRPLRADELHRLATENVALLRRALAVE
jgi:hypothetical protein